MGIECQILLQNATKTFFPGETIQGFVVIVNDSQRNIKGLKVHFEGKCSVQFSESRQELRNDSQERRHHHHHHHETTHAQGSHFETVVQNFTAEETYLDYTMNVFGNDGREMIIMPGRYEYPFQFTLPYGLPSSFEAEHGKIIYAIKAVLPRSWAFDCRTSTEFRVNGILDLNNEPAAQLENNIVQHKTLGCCFCTSGEVSFRLKLLKSGITPGGFIPFVAEINNKTDKILKGSISIYQRIVFFAQGKQKVAMTKVCNFEGPSLAAGEDDIWRGNVVQVPHTIPPTRLGGGCHLIDISYTLQVKLETSGLFSTVKGCCPIVIGTIPLREDISQPNQSIFYSEAPPPPYNSIAGSVGSSSVGYPYPANFPTSNSVNYDTLPTAPTCYPSQPEPAGFKV